MTDKVQKIRKKVEKLMYGFNLEADMASCENGETEKIADIKYQLCKKILEYIDSLQEETVSEDLEQAAITAADEDMQGRQIMEESNENRQLYSRIFRRGFKAGAQWKEELFEKNRLAHCDAQTEEEAEIERDFVMSIIENEHRQPTFDDAIKYGIRLKEEQMINDAYEREVKVDAGGYPYIPQMELYDYDKDEPLAKEGDRVKVIVIKQD